MLCAASATYAVDDGRITMSRADTHSYGTVGSPATHERFGMNAPPASHSWDNPAYNASSIPDNFPWFGNELIGQRPTPEEMAFYAERAARLSGTTRNDLSTLPRSDDLRGQLSQGQYTFERDAGVAAGSPAGSAPGTRVCRDTMNQPVTC
jgi:hypothetical protein